MWNNNGKAEFLTHQDKCAWTFWANYLWPIREPKLNPPWFDPDPDPLPSLLVTMLRNGAAASNLEPIAPDNMLERDTTGSVGGSIPCALFFRMFFLSSSSTHSVFWSMNLLIFCTVSSKSLERALFPRDCTYVKHESQNGVLNTEHYFDLFFVLVVVEIVMIL